MVAANSDKNYETFDATIDGVLTKFKVVEPNFFQQQEALKVRNRTFTDAVESGAFLRAQLNDIMKRRNLWSDDKQMEYNHLEKQILDGKKKLDEGGFKLSEARELALQMHEWRSQLIDMRSVESQLANETAEGQADNASFNYLVSVCVVYNDSNEPVFSSIDDYLNKCTNNKYAELAIQSARCLAALSYGVASDFDKQLPENEFLLEYEFVDEELRLIDEEGNFIDQDGNSISEEDFVEVKVERKPFLTDEGEEVVKKIEEDKEAQESTESTASTESTEETAKPVEKPVKKPVKKTTRKSKKASKEE